MRTQRLMQGPSREHYENPGEGEKKKAEAARKRNINQKLANRANEQTFRFSIPSELCARL
jgi:ribosomal protein S21